MMVGAFGCCNGLLDRALHTNRNAYGKPGCLRPPLCSRALRRRVALIWMNPSRSRCPTQRGEDRRRRVAYNLRTPSRSRWLSTRGPRRMHPSRTEPARFELILEILPRATSSNRFSPMFGRGLTTWRSAAKPQTGCRINYRMSRGFVCCNGLLDQAPRRAVKRSG